MAGNTPKWSQKRSQNECQKDAADFLFGHRGKCNIKKTQKNELGNQSYIKPWGVAVNGGKFVDGKGCGDKVYQNEGQKRKEDGVFGKKDFFVQNTFYAWREKAVISWAH